MTEKARHIKWGYEVDLANYLGYLVGQPCNYENLGFEGK